MIVDFQSKQTPQDFDCDVAIVGAGAVGVLMAVDLAIKDDTIRGVGRTQRYLEDAFAKGMVLTYGVGAYRHEAEATAHARPDVTGILQTSWTVGDTPLNLPDPAPFMITHGAVRPWPTLKTWLAQDPARLKSLSDAVGADLADARILGDLMMAAAISNNEGGLVLVSSTRAERLARHVDVSNNPSTLAQAAKFAKLVGEHTQ